MNDVPPGFLPTPGATASALVAISVLALPPACRDRYRDEFRAELVTLRRSRQIVEAVSLVAGSLALRRAVRGREQIDPLMPAKPLSCRLGKHSYVLVSDDNPENRRNMHKECVHCGKVKEIKEYTRSDGRYIGGLPMG